jgi:hypothetical protein
MGNVERLDEEVFEGAGWGGVGGRCGAAAAARAL